MMLRKHTIVSRCTQRKPKVSCFLMDTIQFLKIIVRFYDYQRGIHTFAQGVNSCSASGPSRAVLRYSQ
jgi:hypothetical protein